MELPKLYYCFDPFCGWCYAFGQIMLEIEEELKSQLKVEVLCGGMITGERIQPLSHVKDYLLEAIPSVEERSNVRFGKSFISLLKEGNYTPNSYPPSIAIQVFKSLSDDRHLEFAHEIQKSYYLYGEDIKSDHYFTTLATRFGLNPNQFMDRWQHLDYFKKTEEEFRKVKDLGIQGFPSVIARMGTQWYLLSRGFVSKEDLSNVIQQWLIETKTKLN